MSYPVFYNNMKKIISVLLLLSLALSLAFCLFGCRENDGNKTNNNYKTLSREISRTYFNTASQISSYGNTSDEEFEKYVKTADETLKYYHRL